MEESKQTVTRQGLMGRGRYRTYILRCWAEPTGGRAVWRFSLHVTGGQRQGFATLDRLAQFLETELYAEPVTALEKQHVKESYPFELLPPDSTDYRDR